MTATVSVVTKEANDVITVPSAAFRYRPPVAERRSGWSLQNLFMPRMPRGIGQRQRDTAPDGMRTLYVLEDGQPKPMRVKTGSTDGELTEIVSGLEAGDLVITGNAPAAAAR
jgi:HlyD family secretion protein